MNVFGFTLTTTLWLLQPSRSFLFTSNSLILNTRNSLLSSALGRPTGSFFNAHQRKISVFGPLVSTEWLAEHLDDDGVAILDVRGEVKKLGGLDEHGAIRHQYRALREEYLESHIPGACFVDWTKDIAGPDENNVPAQLLPYDEFVTAMEERGVGAGKKVVVYDCGRMLWATRLWWALRVYGFDDVAVLNGGWAKWEYEDRPFTSDEPCPLKIITSWGDNPPAHRPELYATADDIITSCITAHQESDKLQLIDARDVKQFTGEEKRARRGGRIPNAISMPYKALLKQEDSYLVFQDEEEIAQTLEYGDVDVACPGIIYCNGGVASTLVLFALHIIGKDGWSNYDGSWNEWGNSDRNFPIEEEV